ncbi:hypothetical protein FISHEDRAFT_61713 [Fistulina hepatica ATCC 64428]|uniref:Transmembrane protein n=1 Tax=Fistulina hepatica ATCC 64428 TaxID=1128425 RepID=A0A0D7A2R3_9AGAR|nr:hypothetical protein FISHEDRAFT_61713 [Fistulina hepatica ATCC 64428]
MLNSGAYVDDEVARCDGGPTFVLTLNTPPAHGGTNDAHNDVHTTTEPEDVDTNNVQAVHPASQLSNTLSTAAEQVRSTDPENVILGNQSQQQILTALAIGGDTSIMYLSEQISVKAPLIASVVSSCTSVICSDFTAALGDDPMSRPARASAVVTLLWCAMVTSLGSAMTAVAGLSLHAGYHDAHVGITKRVVRFLRQWRRERRARRQSLSMAHMAHVDGGRLHPPSRPAPEVLSALTDDKREQNTLASFRAAVVSVRLLGVSVALLAMALAIYLFLLYPLPVAVTTVLVGVVTTAVVAAPMLLIIIPDH